MPKILLLTIGSRGDIQPFIALGKALQAAGIETALQTAEVYQPMVEAYGLPYRFMNNEFMKLAESKAGQAATEGSNNLNLMRQVMPALRQMLQDEWQAVQEFQPDAIVYHPKTLGASHITEKLNIPAVISLALPLYTPTHAYPAPIVPDLGLGSAFNRLSYKLMDMATAPYASVINDFRTHTLGLKKRSRFASETRRTNSDSIPILYAYSPHALPVPEDYPPHVHVTGYWFLESNDGWTPPADLVNFLEAGPPPVYVGFGSMSGAKAEERASVVLQALEASGQRGLLARGWGGLEVNQLPPNMFMLDEAPHDWLFPHVAAVVHHGGAGTTATGLRAGKPTLIIPFIADQPFWGRVVHQIGAGPQPIPQKKLTVDALTKAIEQITTDSTMVHRAEALGEKIRSETGTGNAVKIIQQIGGA